MSRTGQSLILNLTRLLICRKRLQLNQCGIMLATLPDFFHILINIQWHECRGSGVLIKLGMCEWVLFALCVDLCLSQYRRALEGRKSWRKCLTKELGLLIWALLIEMERAGRWTGGEMGLMKEKGMYHFSSDTSGSLHSALADWLPEGH